MTIGRKQFVDLMRMLGIEPSLEELDELMKEMDENNDGSIEFEEFTVAMFHTYDEEMRADAAGVSALLTIGCKGWRQGGWQGQGRRGLRAGAAGVAGAAVADPL